LDLYASNHQQVFLILDSKETFVSVIKSLKQASANISHM
jgi:hypothetical protein